MKKLSKTLLSGAAASLVVAAGIAFAQTPPLPLPSGNTGGSDMSSSTGNGNSSFATQPEGDARARAYRSVKANAGDDYATTDAPVDTASTIVVVPAPVVIETTTYSDTSTAAVTPAPSTDTVVVADNSAELPPRADRN